MLHSRKQRPYWLLKDERILLAGDTYGNINESSDLALACLLPNGTFDSSFGTNGETRTDLGGDETCYGAVVQSDGKIILTGEYDPNGGNPPVYTLITRYNGYGADKQPLLVRVKRWLQHHGISWQGSSNNIRYYSVQRSADGIVYKDIAKVSSKTTAYEDNSLPATVQPPAITASPPLAGMAAVLIPTLCL